MDNQTLKIEVKTIVNCPVEYVWKFWTTPSDIMLWNIPFPNWHSPKAQNNLYKGGSFFYRMETIDGRIGFDHCGKYDRIIMYELIEYTLIDGRHTKIQFIPTDCKTVIIESFDPEKENSFDMQKTFCQSVLHNFKKYAESKNL